MICGGLWWSVVICGGLWYLDSPLIAKDIDIKVAISVEITVTSFIISLRSLIGILIVKAVKSTSFL